ncbi:arginase [Abyssicoccus albus]|uniref:arginase n=1 Tax=Abyssicoccus albus TaxID=1817405 RepID=UPI00097E38E0|nr:arginase [Abyssicoccus albus]AQL56782.1 arginase [Abyssicoccus albus]
MDKKVKLIGAPSSFGQPRLGVDLGPDAIRYTNLVGRIKSLNVDIKDLGNIEAEKINVETHSKEKNDNLRNLEQVIKFNEKLAKQVDEVVENGDFPFIIGGDHSIALGTLSGLSKHYENLGVIWYDAHGDLNDSKTSPSGNIHGMPLAQALGIGHEKLVNLYQNGVKIKPENVVLIGVRDLDDGEIEYIKENNILCFTMDDVARLGIGRVMEETVNYLKNKTDGIHLSLDVDGLDPQFTPGTGTPVVNGITLRETNQALTYLHDQDVISSFEIVEVNPLLDEKNKTAEVATYIAEVFFGKKYL